MIPVHRNYDNLPFIAFPEKGECHKRIEKMCLI
jgi:hypothetical protein